MVSQKEAAAAAEAARQEAERKDAIMEAHLQGTANKATSVETRMDHVEQMMVKLVEQVGGIASQLTKHPRTDMDVSPEPANKMAKTETESRGESRSRSR